METKDGEGKSNQGGGSRACNAGRAAERSPRAAANRYGAQDTQSFALLDLERVTPAIMQRELGLTARTRALLTEARRAGGVWSALVDARLSVADATKLRGRGYLAREAPLHIMDVMPVDGRIQSGRPFAIDISVQNVGEAPVVLASALVTWAGELHGRSEDDPA